MPDQLNVIALISGGKDSLYSILHCLENGHKVIALANLHPEDTVTVASAQTDGDGHDCEGDDLNSFMYQTVGHSIIPLYAECFGLPLYRRAITGSAIQTGRYYDSSQTATVGDETEDLVPLLQEIKHKHPEANAVCSGAILSTYQRTRVESIAVRLGLIPLAYLWQYPALPPPAERPDSLTGLLEDMAAIQCDARIIKIASGGIPESLLWSNVADTRTQKRLVNGLAPFFTDQEFWLRGAVLGEGGEYETLAINGPKKLWKGRIEMPEEKITVLAADGGVSYVKLDQARTVQQSSSSDDQEADAIRIPRSFDEQFQTILSAAPTWGLKKRQDDNESGQQRHLPMPHSEHQMDTPGTSWNITSANLSVSNLTIKDTPFHREHSSAPEQMRHIADHLQAFLKARSTDLNEDTPFTTSNIVSTSLLLRDISDFANINAVYASLFRPGEPNPPARVTFACELPAGIDVSLSVVLNLAPRETRRGLHVQSRSYWAPANIGPYSQAICEPLDHGRRTQGSLNVHDAGLIEIVHVAGQIPLVPESMQVLEGDFVEQAVLSLQHLWRVGQERGIDMWPWGLSLMKSHRDGPARALEACQVWQHAHILGTKPSRESSADGDAESEEGGPDAWDLQFNRSALFQSANSKLTVGDHLHNLPNPRIFLLQESTATFIPPFIAATVTALPRDAPVEWWSVGIANLPKAPSAKPVVTTVTKAYPWGSIALVTIQPSAHTEEEPSEGEELCTDLATVLVNASGEGDIDGIRIAEELTDLSLRETHLDSSARSRLQVAHGTAFIAAKGHGFWARVTRQTLFSSLTAVPCASLFGSPARTRSSESSEFSHLINDSPAATSKSTDAACQPLALAMTIRMERTLNV